LAGVAGASVGTGAAGTAQAASSAAAITTVRMVPMLFFISPPGMIIQ
jgi:hypothetical protein